jgi:hypothetical protein
VETDITASIPVSLLGGAVILVIMYVKTFKTVFIDNIIMGLTSHWPDSGYAKFWDIVVITTADQDQNNIFEAELQDKLNRNELPLKLPIHIISDPPGPKLGK